MLLFFQKLSTSATHICLGLLLFGTWSETSFAGEQLFPTAKHGRGELRYVEGIPVAIFEGTAAEIGEQHAALAAKPVALLLKLTKALFARIGNEESWELAVKASKRLMQQAPERHRQEVAAVAKSAGLNLGELCVANTMLELRRLGCSTLIIEPDRSATGGPLVGRNFDFPSFGILDKYSLVTVVHPKGQHAFVSVGYPMQLGVVTGMNDVGLTVATLDVYETGNGSPQFEPTGVPLTFVFRQILEECETVAEAEQLLKRTKATTWANLAVCDRERGAIFEITPTKVARRDANDSILPCTNHFRAKGLACDTECWRYQRLVKAAQQSKLDVAAVHRHLHAANQGALTLHTMVFEPRELVLHLALGTPPSSAQPLKRLELAPLLSPELVAVD